MNARPALAAACTAALAIVLPTSAVTADAAHAAVGTSAHRAAAAVPAEPTAALATDLLTPLSLTAATDGTLYFGQSLRGAVMRLPVGEAAYRIFQAHGNHQVGGVAVDADQVYFTLSGDKQTFGRLMRTPLIGGKAKVVADLGDFERAHNPDGDQRYGFRRLSSSCASKFPANRNPSALGKEQTTPYALLREGSKTYVADSGANAILKVRGNGNIRTVSVLPKVKTTVTTAFARDNKLPRCTVGKTYLAEAVPTGIAAGPDNTLYVTTLGGGPAAEGGEPHGALWQIDARSGKRTQLVDGLDTPTGVTLAPNGDLYVAELFSGQIVRIPVGTSDVVPFAQPGFPGTLLATPTGLLATTNVLSGTSGKPGDPANAEVVRYAYP